MRRLLLLPFLLCSAIGSAQNCVDYMTNSDNSFTVYLQDGTTYSWGKNNFGQLGNGTLTSVSVLTPTVNAEDWAMVRHARMHTIALDHEGTMWAWGNNDVGQLGNGSTDSYSYTPVSSGTSGWTTISAGNLHAVGLKQDGTIWGWGNNGAMELFGDGETNYYTSPIQLSNDTDWAFVHAGFFKTFAIKTDGTLWGRGRNNAGDLGNGGTFSLMQFTQIGTDPDWVRVSAARAHYTLALKSDHTLWAWGNNENGRLGIGSTVNTYTPTQIPGQWKDVAAGNHQCAAVKTDGTLWSWGSYGWFDGGFLIPDSNVPVQVGTDNDWVSVFSGSSICFALKQDHSIWAWGYNAEGWYGNGTTTSSAIPIMIVGCTNMGNPDLQAGNLLVFPNPAKDVLNWNLDTGIKSYQVINVLGQTVKSGNGATSSIELSGMPYGIYVLMLESADGKIHKSKFIKE